jgi:hypothetical protein
LSSPVAFQRSPELALSTTDAFARSPRPRSGKVGYPFIRQYQKYNIPVLENIHESFDMEQMGLKPVLKWVTEQKSM